MDGSACFDKTGAYRYRLSRCWEAAQPAVAFVMLNPSQADGVHNDPTIRRCIGLAKFWGYGSLEVVNLFGYCTAHPRMLLQVSDPVGQKNDRHLVAVCEQVDRVLLAWGNWGSKLGRDRTVLSLLEPYQAKFCCLGLNQTGLPRHPLYVKRDTPPLVW